MNASEFAAMYGEPKGWELAIAITEQIDSYRRAAAIVASGKLPPIPAAATGFRSPGQSDADRDADRMERCIRRIQEPIVDVEKARQATAGISESGGWGRFISLPETA